MRILYHLADAGVRRQLVRAIDARDNARAGVRVLRKHLEASREEVEELAIELIEARAELQRYDRARQGEST